MILSLRNSLFLAMAVAVQHQANALIDPDWYIANELDEVARDNGWWKTYQNTGDPNIDYYANSGSWTFPATPNTWDGYGNDNGYGDDNGKGYIRIEVPDGIVKRTWIRTTIDGVPGSGACDVLESLKLKFDGGDNIPLNDGFYIFVDGVYTGVMGTVSGTYHQNPRPNSLGTSTFLQWETVDAVVIPIGGSASESHEIAIAIEEDQAYGGFFEVEFEPTLVSDCGTGGGAGGDPHFNTWANTWYDFHGICDLLLLKVDNYVNGLGLDIHIRTAPRYQYSYIEAAALKIGEDVLEIGSWGEFWFNGVEGADMPILMGGELQVTHTQEDKKHHYEIRKEGSQDAIVITTFKDMVSVMVQNATVATFGNSVGMMGSFPNGQLLARDGKTVVEDHAVLGQEWQVLPSEPKLFLAESKEQELQTCVPPVARTSRRLGEGVSVKDAEKACAQKETEELRDMCVFDVIAMADLEVAEINGVF